MIANIFASPARRAVDGSAFRATQLSRQSLGTGCRKAVGSNQRRGGVRWNGANAEALWGKDQSEPDKSHVDRGDAERKTECHGKSFLSVIEMSELPVGTG